VRAFVLRRELHRQLKALGNKTIICNGTGQISPGRVRH
jgi:hypothetical protein